MEIPIKMDDLGVPLFLETPICSHLCLGGDMQPPKWAGVKIWWCITVVILMMNFRWEKKTLVKCDESNLALWKVISSCGWNSDGMNLQYLVLLKTIGGGFKYVYDQPQTGEMIQFDCCIFSTGLVNQPPTRKGLHFSFVGLDTPRTTNECPLKIDGWFRCISYRNNSQKSHIDTKHGHICHM